MFIHERPDWPRLQWDDRVVRDPLALVRHRQGWLLGRMAAIGFDLQSAAVLETLTRDVVTTSQIEGEQLDRAQVRSSIARHLGLDIGALVPSDRAVDGVVAMMLDATQRFDQPLTAERLYDWHAGLFPTGRSGITRIRVGAWRDGSAGPMQVVSGPIGRERVHFQAPDAERLDAEMERFLVWFDAPPTTDPVIHAALAHLWFITIHPFEDGNGRIARALADMALARAEGSPKRFYSLSAQIQADRTDYYTQLERAQRGSLDVTQWLLWFLASLGRAIDQAETVLATVLQAAQFWQAHRDAPLTQRQRDMITRLLGGFRGKLTTSKWALICKCSQDTALRDIEGLIALGILAKDTAGGRSTSYSLVLPVVDTGLTPPPPDPMP
ncbi:MAG: Fic family protein [Alphaproteobacteria bacterium]|nr:MAG: Fic family protein [Alphaproteobacteria bacterium]